MAKQQVRELWLQNKASDTTWIHDQLVAFSCTLIYFATEKLGRSPGTTLKLIAAIRGLVMLHAALALFMPRP